MVVDNIFYAAHVESLTACLGISLVVERGFMNVSSESDAFQIVSALQRQSIDRSFLGPIVEDTKTLLTQIIREGFTHIYQNANDVAHHIVKLAAHIGTFVSWFEEPLDFIVDILFKDCN